MTISKTRNMLLYLAYCTAIFAICFFIIELVLRSYGFGNLIIYDSDELLYWKPRPNQLAYTKINHQEIKINRHGTRGADFEVPKPDGIFRIISLGDSRTFGWGLQESDTYSRILQDSLNSMGGRLLKTEVVNAGVNGWSYDQIYLYLREIGLKFEPDLVILGMANLWTQFREDSATEFRKAFAKRVVLKNLLRQSALYHYVVEVRLKKYYEKYRKNLIPSGTQRDDVKVFEDQPIESFLSTKSTISRIIDLLSAHNVPILLLYIPHQEELMTGSSSPIIRMMNECLTDELIRKVDVTSRFSQEVNSFYLEADPVHPTAAGNRVIAQSLKDAIKNRNFLGERIGN